MVAACAQALVLTIAQMVWLSSAQPQSTSSTQPTTQNPQPQSSQPAKSTPKKKPEEPIDPDSAGGVRGAGTTHTVRVLLKGKPAEGAHVVVKNTNGTVAATCYTSDAGECQVSMGADNYVIEAKSHGRAGTVTERVDDESGTIVIKLGKAKTADNSPKP